MRQNTLTLTDDRLHCASSENETQASHLYVANDDHFVVTKSKLLSNRSFVTTGSISRLFMEWSVTRWRRACLGTKEQGNPGIHVHDS